MLASGTSNRRLTGAGLLLALLLGLCSCGAVPAGGAGQARAPGVHFHNDVVLFNAVGVSSSRR